MKLIKTMTKSELVIETIDIISKTYIELGQHNVEEETLEVLAESLADDLQPNTTLQIKFRENPDKVREKQAELQTEKLLEVMRLKVSNTGS